MSYCWMSRSQLFSGSLSLHLQGSSSPTGLSLKMKTLRFFESSENHSTIDTNLHSRNTRTLNHAILKTSSCIHVYLVVFTKLIIQCNCTVSYKNYTTVLLACDNILMLNLAFYLQSTATFRHCGFKPLCSSFDRSRQWRILPSQPEM